MTTIGIAAEDGPGAAAMIAAGPGAPPMNAVLVGLRALESELLATLLYSPQQFPKFFHVVLEPVFSDAAKL